MITDDPKFTAYVLDELEPEEREKFEAELAREARGQAETQELRQLTERLRAALAAEGPLELTPEQRARMLAAAAEVVPSARPKVIPLGRRVWVPSALAASLALMLGIWFFHPATRDEARNGPASGSLPQQGALPEGEQLPPTAKAEQEKTGPAAAPASPELAAAPIVTANQAPMNGAKTERVDAGRSLPSAATMGARDETRSEFATGKSIGADAPGARPDETPTLSSQITRAVPTQSEASKATAAPARALAEAPTRMSAEAAPTGAAVPTAMLKIAPVPAASAPASVQAPAPTVAAAAAVGGSTSRVRASGDDFRSAAAQPFSATAPPTSAPADPKPASDMVASRRAALPATTTAKKLESPVTTASGESRSLRGTPEQSGDIPRMAPASPPADASMAGRVNATPPVQVQTVARPSEMAPGSKYSASLTKSLAGPRRIAMNKGRERTWDRDKMTDEPQPDRPAPEEPNATEGEAYISRDDNPFVTVREQPLSTFSIDVDTASYTNVRRMLQAGERPPRDAVRIEEMLNFFTYDYPPAPSDAPCSVTMEAASCPWEPGHRLVRLGLKAREIPAAKRPPANLVFLLDVSGSMEPENRLPLARQSLRLLTDQLGPEDRVSIVTYAGNSGIALEPTSDKAKIRAALNKLEAGGSTNGAAGIQQAYELAKRGFAKGQINRVILATDGDFNVGVTDRGDLTKLIKREAKSGVFLTVLGFGYGNLKDATLEKLADTGNGNYAYINDLTEGRRVLVEQMGATLQTVAKDVKVQVEFNPAKVSGYRLIGYEKRMLQARDFSDDTKDAGEMGSGHTVTALYEIVPAGGPFPGTAPIEKLKYQASTAAEATASPAAASTPSVREFTGGKREPGAEQPGITEAAKSLVTGAPASNETLTLKLRWKEPEGEQSELREFTLTDEDKAWVKSSVDFRWAAAVAEFGMLLRDSPHAGDATWGSLKELAAEGKGADKSGYRQEMISLIDQAKAARR